MVRSGRTGIYSMKQPSTAKPYLGLTPHPPDATRDAMEIAKRGMLPLVEVFYSLQGEGLRTGQATVFVRFAGCNCDCWFCDTDFRVRESVAIDTLLETIADIGGDCRWVCLTGGEPTIHDLAPLCGKLHDCGYRIQVETNGSRPRPSWELDHITVSPKVHEGARLDPWYFKNATEFKHVIDDQYDIELATDLAAKHDKSLYLQPNSHNPAAATLCIDAVKREPHRFRLSLQTHKLLSIP